jgi:peroxiredoxin
MDKFFIKIDMSLRVAVFLRRSNLLFLLILLLLSPAALAMSHLSEQAINNQLVGKTAPDLVLSKTDGASASIMAARQGQKAVLIFWATWCPHCYEELGAINNQVADIEKKGIKVILVDMGETKEDVQEYFLKRQMKLISFVDTDSALQEPYHLVGIPTLVFVDEKGVVCNVTHVFPADYETFFRK